MSTRQFAIHTEFIPLNALLKVAGIAQSGAEASQMVVEGLVTVDGVVETRKRCKIRTGQVVRLGEECVEVVGR